MLVAVMFVLHFPESRTLNKTVLQHVGREITWWVKNPCPDTAVPASALSPASWVSRSFHLYTQIYLYTVKNEPNQQKVEFCSPPSFLCCSQLFFGQHLARSLWTVNSWSTLALAVVVSPEGASCPCFPALALAMPCWKGTFIPWGLPASRFFLSASQTPTPRLVFLWQWWSLLVSWRRFTLSVTWGC